MIVRGHSQKADATSVSRRPQSMKAGDSAQDVRIVPPGKGSTQRMNVITVSREYGAGGGETARKLAEALGWEVLDRELLHQAAAIEHVPDAEIERLDEQAIRLLDRLSFQHPHKRYMHGLTEAVQRAAAKGKVVLIGRGTRQILDELPGAFHLRLVAPREWRAERMARREGWSVQHAQARCQEVDRARQRFNAYFFGRHVDTPDHYDLVVNS